MFLQTIKLAKWRSISFRILKGVLDVLLIISTCIYKHIKLIPLLYTSDLWYNFRAFKIVL